MRTSHDVIVIGSGIGGLSCAAALARLGQKVLVLEQHYVAGGLTQSFSRKGFTWDVGVHYLGKMGPGNEARRILDWLSGGRVEMSPVGPAYDIIHFPDGFEVTFESPAEALKQQLEEKFKRSSLEVDAFFSLLTRAAGEYRALFISRILPRPLAWFYSLWAGGKIRRWWGRTTDEVLREVVHDEKLKSVLTAQWMDHGGRPSEGSFAMHAIIMNYYMDGAFYPAGGSRVFADTLIPVIEKAGGGLRLKSRVREIILSGSKAVGVRLEDGKEYHAGNVVSDIGAKGTIRLLPQPFIGSPWAAEVMSIRPSYSHICLYLGFEGDISTGGATAANHWFYNTWDTDSALWTDPAATEPPLLFVSFPSLKDSTYDAGQNYKHTAEVVAPASWDAFSGWADSRHGSRPEGYKELKKRIEEKMLAGFNAYFPGIAPMVTYQELSTPLTELHYTKREQGASYGLETTPRRFLSRALGVRTPVKGLYLAGQDPVTPGITGAMMGGILAAGMVDRRVLRHIR